MQRAPSKTLEMTGVGLDTKSVSNKMHTQWLDLDQFSDDQTLTVPSRTLLGQWMKERWNQPGRRLAVRTRLLCTCNDELAVRLTS